MSRITLYVKVSDQNKNGGWSQPIGVEGSLFIDVNNINERPVMDPAGPFYFKKFSPSGTEIGTLTATDPDQNVLGDRHLVVTLTGFIKVLYSCLVHGAVKQLMIWL